MDILLNAAKASGGGTTFYHFTNKDKLDSILSNGLIPQKGNNSLSVGEPITAVWLTGRDSLPYWRIMLGRDSLLKVSGLDVPDVLCRPYSGYEEYFYEKVISPECLSVIELPPVDLDVMHKLCIGYIFSINSCCSTAASCYKYGAGTQDRKEYSELLEMYIDNILSVVDKLDWSVVDKKDIVKELEYEGANGGYTFCDWYKNTGKRLWEQLILYEEDHLSDKRRHIYDYIVKTFDGCLYTETGGWTG